jgi:NAD(P)-dependent dehydrogenase (short-subunit alcohol dehydrogenase family)
VLKSPATDAPKYEEVLSKDFIDGMGELPLQGKAALVTGASRGLGLEVACYLGRAGASLALIARDEEALRNAATRVRAAASKESTIRIYVADLACEQQLDAAASACLDDFKRIDVLINNAAIQGPIGRFAEANWEAWRQVLQVNFLAPARLCQLFIPGMHSSGWGKVINVSGGGATGPRPNLSAYAAAKCALVRLSETLAEEHRGSGVHVNCVAPGPMNTRMLNELIAAGPGAAPQEYDRALARLKNGGNSPERAAQCILWLATPASDGISGRLIAAVWDDWMNLDQRREKLADSDVYTLRRIVPEDRGIKW